MANLTRRGLLKKATVGAGVAGLLAATAGSEAFAAPVSSQASLQPNKQAVNTTDEPMVVWVTNPAAGTLVIMRGKQAVTINNPTLVNSLLSLS